MASKRLKADHPSSSTLSSSAPNSSSSGQLCSRLSEQRAVDSARFLESISAARFNWGSAQHFPFCEERFLRIDNSKSQKSEPVLLNAAAGECVLYWMSRDCRVQDNWAFIYAQKIALQSKVPLMVVFCLVPKFADATIRAYKFLLGGLREVRQECDELGVPFHLLIGCAKDVLPDFMKSNRVTTLVCDFSPLRIPLSWVNSIREQIGAIPFYHVDAHNIVPCWKASEKQEVGARTIRGKIHKLLDQYHTAFPPIIKHPWKSLEPAPEIDWLAAENSLEVNRDIDEVDWAKPGTTNGFLMLYEFLTERLKNYSKRNDPNVAAQSQLSPWFKFGQISVARAVIEANEFVQKSTSLKPAYDSFFEEAVIRRELADNFCFYNKDYDNLNGAAKWAKETLEIHAKDPRPRLYTLKELEEGQTADDLWNAAQLQMKKEGKMHGFLRMYWAKKILEWTESPEKALQYSILLNDKYNIDGRDPNGYVGCMWSICGIHDMGWKERSVFGKIRYMNYDGCKRKFDVPAFVEKYRK